MTLCRSCITNFHIFLIIFCVGIHSKTDPAPDYTTCDFDLEDIEGLLPYLPSICSEIYSKRAVDVELYDSYLAESKAFAKFHKQLNDYELRSYRNQPEPVQLEVYPFEADTRWNIYERVTVNDCVASANGTVQPFLNCRKEQHLAMEQLVPKEPYKSQ